MTKSQSKIVRALDLGWGYAKYSHLNKETGKISFSSFPSLAPRHTGMDLSMGSIGQRDTVVVDVDGTKFEVGPDSADLDSNDASRNLNDQYISTEQYKAVLFGAMHYIGEPVIDVLVVGLPLSSMNLGAKLKALALGIHKINATTTIEVKDVLVLPQPLGGLYHCLSLADSRKEFSDLSEETNLIIDPGFLTFDFLLSNGEKVIENRSSAHNAGVSKILRSIADSISIKHGIKYENLSAIDKGLRKRKMKINGVNEDMDEHIKNTRSVLEAAVNYMKNMVGDGSDLDNIILLGGGSSIFQKTIAAYYPKHTIIVVEDGQTANVRGFQLAGERYLEKNTQQITSPPSKKVVDEEGAS
jgi:plasmid segregation protein ParM